MTKAISVIIPVFNEADNINKLLSQFKSSPAGDNYELIIVDGSPGRETLLSIKDPGSAVLLSGNKGRAAQMNLGAARASGEILLFLHADSALPAGAFERVRETVSGGSVAGAFELELDPRHPFLVFISFTANLRSRLFKTPFGDQAIFVKKEFFESIGGYRDLPLMEDLDLMKRIRKARGKIKIIGAPVLSSARQWEKRGFFINTLRNQALRSLYLMGADVRKLARLYYG
jgi:rSAM/selenodomain-associated transferase 2